MSVAAFNESDHCTKAGFATYHHRVRFSLRCWLFGHKFDTTPPPNYYCPQSYRRCSRCRVFFHWFDVGIHRYGGWSADIEWLARREQR